MKKTSGISIGTSSILVIFVLLCLITFATLSLATAGADYKLAVTATSTTTEYYNAETEAVRRLEQLDFVLRPCAAAALGEDEAAYVASAYNTLAALPEQCTLDRGPGNTLFASYTVQINAAKEIQVRLQITLSGNSPRYSILRWQTVNTAPWVPDENLPVWQP